MEKEDSKFHVSHEEFTERAFNNPSLLPDRYVFILTNLCNLNCDFCFQEKKLKSDVMNDENWIALINQLPEYSRITLTGGEPLMYPGFKKIFSHTASKFNCNLITNGLLLNERKIELLLSFPNFKVLSISIDDIGNKSRGLTDEQWSYLVKTLKYFVKRKKELNSECILDIKTMILDKNADGLFKIHKFFMEELNCDTHVFQFLKGSPIQHADFMFEFDEISKKSRAYIYKKWDIIKKQLEKIKEYNIKNNKTCYLHPKGGSLTSNSLLDIDHINKEEHIKEKFQNCRFPWSSVHINFNGDLFPCLAIFMGNVKEKPLKEIINGKEMSEFRKLIQINGTLEACNRCGWLRLKN